MQYSQQEFDGMLVGDAGYPALLFLLTPIAHPETDEEIRYDINIAFRYKFPHSYLAN